MSSLPSKTTSRIKRRNTLAGYMFFMPALIGLVFLNYGQMIASLVISFTDWNVFKDPSFVGVKNYIELFTEDPFFWKSLRVTILYAFGSVLVTQLTALALALLLNIESIKGRVVFRVLFYLPAIVPAVANSILWLWLFNPNYGLLNALLKMIGLPTSKWIFGETTAVPSLILMNSWGCGGAMVIYLAGLSNVPKSLLEAVEIDGGGTWTKFIHCTLPMISPSMFYNGLMGIINGFMVFTSSYIMTGGGPNNATLFINYLIYREAFQNNRMGYSSALAWIIFVLLALLTLVIFRFFGKKVYYGSSE